MASFCPPIENSCFHCKVETDKLSPGWPRRFGGFVMLCGRCVAAYEDGTFCSVFHPEATGWRTCATCDKRVHCGCIMSTLTHTILDFGGVKCMDCFKEQPSAQLQAPPASAAEILMSMSGATVVKLSAPKKAVSRESGEESSVNSPDDIDAAYQSDAEKSQRSTPEVDLETPTKNVHAQIVPKSNDEELEQLSKESKSIFIPLFEKELTASDAEPKNGRLVLPKRCAEAYLPKVKTHQRVPIIMQDTRGNDWQFYYRVWANSNGKMFILEGLKEFVTMIKWKSGDKVIFYRREPEGNLVVGVSRIEAGESGEKASA